MTKPHPDTVTANGRDYCWPDRPLVVICLDGCEPDYITQAVIAGVAPTLARFCEKGSSLNAECAMPSFTNPNNLSIVTGAPPSVHGICGNYFLDPERGEEVMMNEPHYLRCDTLLARFAEAGGAVAVITAKDKLRTLLGKGLQGICFSAERANELTLAGNGITGVLDRVNLPLPSVYSQALSEFVFAAGAVILRAHRPDILYLSTTDYIQHKHAPGTAQANAFYAMLDPYLATFEELGARIAITADHGMNAKTDAAGQAQIIYLQDWFDRHLGSALARVILPITDPYIAHHGSLGSFATVYLPTGTDASAIATELARLTGIESVLTRPEAALELELPADRIGDLVVIAERLQVLGTTASRHDLSGLDAPLRSHGGRSEQIVPMLFSHPLAALEAGKRWRNFDIFDLALNHRRPA